jgi:hypothetical protein
MVVQILVGAGAFFLLSVAVGLLIGRAMRPTARMQPKPRKGGE